MPIKKNLAFLIWFQTIISYIPIVFLCIYIIKDWDKTVSFNLLIVTVLSFTIGIPAFIVLYFGIQLIRRFINRAQIRVYVFQAIIILICLTYGGGLALADEALLELTPPNLVFLEKLLINTAWVLAGGIITIIRYQHHINQVFNYQKIKTKNTMDTNESLQQETEQLVETNTKESNHLILKASIVGGLILVMLVPMIFLDSLVNERKTLKDEVVTEVSSKWAGKQFISNPYILLPYTDSMMNDKGRQVTVTKFITVLPEDNKLDGELVPELRKRSIYEVPLYHADVTMKGYFNLSQIEKYIPLSKIDFSKAKICLGLTEFKGIEESISIRLNESDLNLLAGLPYTSVHENGVSALFPITYESLGKKLNYDMKLKVKGSVDLMFEPLSGNSHFNLHSTWPSPSFMGNQLPGTREVSDSGFKASWSFNQANLPFDLILPNKDISEHELSFGLSLLQPIDSYSQTKRCIKYAILIIGLTFSLFFIIEIMQKNAFHPVQYLLVGLAVSVFYTLLLSISEFLNFPYAYLIASAATVCLIAYYAFTHFKNVKTSFVFGGFISLLYAFIFVLLTLEDTALLAGSVSLFIILASVMYFTRKINWYKL